MPVAIVTGAGARIGQAVALALAADGFDLAVHYRASAEGAEHTVSQIQERGGKAVAFKADLASAVDIDAMMDAVSARLGPATRC